MTLQIIQFKAKDSNFVPLFKRAMAIRHKVFVIEQNVNLRNEIDHIDFNMSDADFKKAGQNLIKYNDGNYFLNEQFFVNNCIEFSQFETVHFIACDQKNQDFGTMRMFYDQKDGSIVHIGRMGIYGEYRGKGIGKAIINYALNCIRDNFQNARIIQLHAQSDKQLFYEKCGFSVDDSVPEFIEEGIKHVIMYKNVN